MNYQESDITKIVPFGKNAAVGITGKVDLMKEFLEDAKQHNLLFSQEGSPTEAMNTIAGHFRALYQSRFGVSPLGDKELSPTTLTFAGQGRGNQTLVYQVHANGNFRCLPMDRLSVCGQDIHGGCYYLCRFYRPEMDIKAAAFLAYFCICEVASLDGAVGVPVEIWKSEQGNSEPVEESWMAKFKDQHEEARSEMERWFGIRQSASQT